mgnify:CR=1 FL=1
MIEEENSESIEDLKINNEEISAPSSNSNDLQDMYNRFRQ